jgi:hypothetical protein
MPLLDVSTLEGSVPSHIDNPVVVHGHVDDDRQAT